MKKIKLSQLKTGDLLLCCYHASCCGIDKMIQFFTHSNWTHCAIILRDPTFIHPALKGLYVWQSGDGMYKDPQDGKIKNGVQITPLRDLLKGYSNGYVAVRSVHSKLFTKENLENIHKVVYDKPYDTNVIDWAEALVKKDLNPQKTSRFWCSAFIGYIYTKCGLLDPKTDWSILSPNDFDMTQDNIALKWTKGNFLENILYKIN